MTSHCNPQLTPEQFEALLPTTFTIETALACNLKCPECALGGAMITRRKELLSFDRFKHIADKSKPFAQYYYLHLWGEPILNPNILDMIRYVSNYAKANISTNALLLNKALCEDLITSGVTDLIVSIDGMSQEVYSKYRVGGDVEVAKERLAWLQEANIRNGNRVAISPQFIVFKHNQHEKEQFAAMCQQLGLEPCFKAPYIRVKDSRLEYSELCEFRRPEYETVQAVRCAMQSCDNPKNVFTILADGSVVICCHDYDRATCFGNIFEQDVLEIWNSAAYRAFRWKILTGAAPDFCIKYCMSFLLKDDALESFNRTSESSNLKTLADGTSNETSMDASPPLRVNLCGGTRKIDGHINVDLDPIADIVLDLETSLLPFETGTVDTLVCISAINYFSKERALEIIRDVHRVLKPGGVTRFGVQDLHILASHYVNRNREFWFQKLPNGSDRFPGRTFAEKFGEFYRGFRTAGDKCCKEVYDFEMLSVLFEEAGFQQIEQKRYQESTISGIDQIDNRPEQMFFLEARKAQAARLSEPRGADRKEKQARQAQIAEALNRISVRMAEKLSAEKTPPQSSEPTLRTADEFTAAAANLWSHGEKEKAWQHYLKALDIDTTCEHAVTGALTILLDMKKRGGAEALLVRYMEAGGKSSDVLRLAQAIRSCPLDIQLSPMEHETRARALLNHNRYAPHSGGNAGHLREALAWLRRAQQIRPGGGVASVYYALTREWGEDYPETTGYIIPTFIEYGRLTSDRSWKDFAIAAGKWELAIQDPDGGIGEPLGVYGLRPRVFNTSQVILGLVALYCETREAVFLDGALKAGRWILSVQDADGKWSTNDYQGARTYHARSAWALMELGAVSGERLFIEGGMRAVEWIFSKAMPNGWFSETSLSDPQKPWTHLVGYTLVGLLKMCEHFSRELPSADILEVLKKAAGAICRTVSERHERMGSERYSGLPGTLDPGWTGNESWSCLTGDTQIEFFLRRLGRVTQNSAFTQCADDLIEGLKRVQAINASEAEIRGALFGSWPIEGDYCSFSVPNWAVKFYADSILQTLVPEATLRFLG